MWDVTFPLNLSAVGGLTTLTLTLTVIFVAARMPLKRRYHYVFILFLCAQVLSSSTFAYGQISGNAETYNTMVWWTYLALYLRDPLLYLFILSFINPKIRGLARYTLIGVWAYDLFLIGLLIADPTLIYSKPRITSIGFASQPGALTQYLAPLGIDLNIITTGVLGPAVLIQHYRSKQSPVIRNQVRYLLIGLFLLAVGLLTYSVARYLGGINPRTYFTAGGAVVMLLGLRRHGFSAIIPANEMRSETPLKNRLPQGSSYLSIETEPKYSFVVFSNMVMCGHQGLCISRFSSEKIRENYRLKTTPLLWLTEEKSKDAIAPSDLRGLLLTIKAFRQMADKPIVMLHGLEYLISTNGFRAVLRLVVRLNDLTTEEKGILLIPVAPGNLTERQLKLLRAQCPSMLRLEDTEIYGAIISSNELKEDIQRRPAVDAQPALETPAQKPTNALSFENQDTATVFRFLGQVFLKDYAVDRIAIESSGWQTALDIAEGTNLPTYKTYGHGGKPGVALAELLRRGLVETRWFPGQRGRGGTIMKVRVNYGNPYVKEEIDRLALQP